MRSIDPSKGGPFKDFNIQKATLGKRTDMDRALSKIFNEAQKLTQKSSFKIEHHHPTYPPEFEPKLYAANPPSKKGKRKSA